MIHVCSTHGGRFQNGLSYDTEICTQCKAPLCDECFLENMICGNCRAHNTANARLNAKPSQNVMLVIQASHAIGKRFRKPSDT